MKGKKSNSGRYCSSNAMNWVKWEMWMWWIIIIIFLLIKRCDLVFLSFFSASSSSSSTLVPTSDRYIISIFIFFPSSVKSVHSFGWYEFKFSILPRLILIDVSVRCAVRSVPYLWIVQINTPNHTHTTQSVVVFFLFFLLCLLFCHSVLKSIHSHADRVERPLSGVLNMWIMIAVEFLFIHVRWKKQDRFGCIHV